MHDSVTASPLVTMETVGMAQRVSLCGNIGQLARFVMHQGGGVKSSAQLPARRQSVSTHFCDWGKHGGLCSTHLLRCSDNFFHLVETQQWNAAYTLISISIYHCNIVTRRILFLHKCMQRLWMLVLVHLFLQRYRDSISQSAHFKLVGLLL